MERSLDVELCKQCLQNILEFTLLFSVFGEFSPPYPQSIVTKSLCLKPLPFAVTGVRVGGMMFVKIALNSLFRAFEWCSQKCTIQGSMG
ncbi:hypothetical protein CEXT_247071 [Caerostris extrusa]|uniref:Uncharacterized protein n=1 Tax=Caerostris extrusa TaxID=172846 RepID=A0AAV4WHM7_CAEEX|nr:hypothetical protein CEXT_247071 [Caerostris extrusa]